MDGGVYKVCRPCNAVARNPVLPHLQVHRPAKDARKDSEEGQGIGREAGLKYVYEGNVPGEGGENTYCPSCGELLIERYGFSIVAVKMKDSKCSKCGHPIDGIGMP